VTPAAQTRDARGPARVANPPRPCPAGRPRPAGPPAAAGAPAAPPAPQLPPPPPPPRRSTWKRLSPEERELARRVLLERLTAEPSGAVRKSVMGLVGVLARHAVPRGEWPGLLGHLAGCAGSADEGHRAAALGLFQLLAEDAGDSLRAHFGALAAVLGAGLRDPAPAVRAPAARAVAGLVPHCVERGDAPHVRDMVRGCVEAARRAAAEGEEDVVAAAVDAVGEAVRCPAPEVRAMVGDLVAVAMEVALRPSLDLPVRVQALQVVETLAAFKPKLLARQGSVPDLCRALCAMAAEPVEGEAEGEDLPPGPADPASRDADPLHVAQDALGAVAGGLPAKLVSPPVLEFARGALAGGGAGRPERTRRAGLAALAALAEGCPEALRRRVPALLELALPCLRDPAPKVRAGAAYCLLALAEFLRPQILDHAAALVPAVLATLDDPSPAVVERVCWALDTFTEHLGEDVAPYVDALMARLLALLEHGAAAQPRLLEPALSVVASVASAAERRLAGYAEGLLPALEGLLARPGPGVTADARARATECAGLLLGCVDRDRALHFAPGLARAALPALGTDSPELREYTFGFFSHLFEAVGPAAAELLPAVAAAAMAACRQDDGCGDGGGGGGGGGDSDGDGDGGGDSDSDGDSDGGRGRLMEVRTGVMEEKCSAAQCLGKMARHAGPAFLPLLPEVVPLLETLATYFHPHVRGEAYVALAGVASAASAAFPGPGPGVASAEAAEAAGRALGVVAGAFLADDDRGSVASAIEAAAEVVGAVPAGSVLAALTPVAEGVARVLAGQAVCQERGSDSDADGELDEDEASPEEGLLAAVGDFLPALARSMGAAAFAPLFTEHLAPPLLAHARATQPDPVRAAALGTLAEVVEVLGAHAGPVAERAVQLALREMRGPGEDECRRNAAYLGGVTAAACPERCAGAVGRLLEALQGMLENGGSSVAAGRDEAEARDNALGAVCRIAGSPCGASLPAARVVGGVLQSLPMSGDLEEAGAVYGYLGRALLALDPGSADMGPHVAGIVAALGAAAAQEGLPADARRRAAEDLLAARGRGGAVAAAVDGLSDAHKAAAQAALQG